MKTSIELGYLPKEKVEAVLRGLLDNYASSHKWRWSLTKEGGHKDGKAIISEFIEAKSTDGRFQMTITLGPVPLWRKSKLIIWRGDQDFCLEKNAAEKFKLLEELELWVRMVLSSMVRDGGKVEIYSRYYGNCGDEEGRKTRAVDNLIASLRQG
jgi:hypothetical protein